ncbi:hypothetical protein NKH77_53610 [Streptomyces sp. M19]
MADPLSDFAAATYAPGQAGSIGTTAPGSRAATLRHIVWEKHWAAISAVCKRYHYTIAVRETGEYSIKRVMEGQAQAAHHLGEIHQAQLREEQARCRRRAGAARPEAVLRWLKSEDLDGFVGHWDERG